MYLRLTLFIFLLFSMTSCNISSGITPEVSMNEPNQNYAFDFIRMINDKNGWAIINGFLYHTNDDGKTWTKTKYNQKINESKLFVLDAKNAYLLENKDNQLTVLSTNNMGDTWNASKPIVGLEPIIFFLDQNKGWIKVVTNSTGASLYEAISLYQTTDHTNWSLISESSINGEKSKIKVEGKIDDESKKLGLTFIDQNSGWINTLTRSQGNQWIYHTVDGGHQWEKQELPSLNNSVNQNATYSFEKPMFFGNDALMLSQTTCSGKPCTLIFKSEDKGKTWNYQSKIDFDDGNRLVYSFINANHGWIAFGNKLYTTENGGLDWKLTTTQNYGKFNEIQFMDKQKGKSVINGKLFLTNDMGMNWKKQNIILE